MLEAIALTIMGAWLVVLGGGFLLREHGDRPSALLIVIAGVYAILWQEPAIAGFSPAEFFHVSLAQPVFLLFLSGAVFGWAYWLFQEHAEALEGTSAELADALSIEKTLRDILAHDLRNPLTVAQNRLALLVSTAPATRAQADPIQESLLRAERIIEDSLVYSNLSSGDDLVRSSTDLRALVDDAVDALDPLADIAGTDVTVQGPPTLEAPVTPLFRHAIENLLDNAIKYSPPGETIEVALSENAGDIRLHVRDRGPGLDEQDRERLFERFQRGQNALEEGTGLGLAIVQRLVDAHDGSLTVEQTPGGGTTVVTRLPGSLPQREAPHRPPTPSTATVPAGGAR